MDRIQTKAIYNMIDEGNIDKVQLTDKKLK
jgi:hypothetical protein